MSKKIAESYPDKNELVQYLLNETGQKTNTPTDPDVIIQSLNLDLVSFDFTELSEDFKDGRVLLSYNQKTIAINSTIPQNKINFSKFHEISHYVLPEHRKTAYFLCNDFDMSLFTKVKFEEEANAFAADLIYKGDLFTIESNSVKISFDSILGLREKYGSSIESTARRFVENSLYPCLFVVYEKQENIWRVRYSIFSKPFLDKYLQSKGGSLTDDNNEDVIKADLLAGQIIESECKINFRNEKEIMFDCEYFNNRHNILSIVKEK